ncbi:type II secretion system F family protein [Caulobacter sp. NIBR2454]|uniref:type II secretion system F family protein n=1 Tax=Caulobacter sp. NIBR2454 TaxID=3015996 RepID=UPI0022B62480|nr:type II secretion system F family protein [Caulobacter sp. NIBR2454]
MSGQALIFFGAAVAALSLAGAGLALWRLQAFEAILDARLEAMQEESQVTGQKTLRRGVPVASDRIRALLAQAGLTPTPREVIALLAMLILIKLAVGAALNPLIGVLVALATALAGLLLVVRRAATRRQKFAEGLPHYLDSARQLLSVGNSLQQALDRALAAAGPDVTIYMDPMNRRIANGAPVAEAMAWNADRLRLPELRIAALALETQVRFGGSVSPMLARLSQLLRDRTRTQRELSAASAETRMSALIISVMPFAAVALLSVLNPPYVTFLFTSPEGHAMLMIAGVLQVLGGLLLRQLMRLDY